MESVYPRNYDVTKLVSFSHIFEETVIKRKGTFISIKNQLYEM